MTLEELIDKHTFVNFERQICIKNGNVGLAKLEEAIRQWSKERLPRGTTRVALNERISQLKKELGEE